MIKSQFIDDFRKDKSNQEVPFDEEKTVVAEIGRNPLDEVLISKEHLQRVLRLISSEERELLFLWALEGYSTQEIAEHLDVPKGTILAKIFRLRKRLQNHFSQLGVEGRL
jgi:RNA polymerase sigma-70 factor (ECF subfamily)